MDPTKKRNRESRRIRSSPLCSMLSQTRRGLPSCRELGHLRCGAWRSHVARNICCCCNTTCACPCNALLKLLYAHFSAATAGRDHAVIKKIGSSAHHPHLFTFTFPDGYKPDALAQDDVRQPEHDHRIGVRELNDVGVPSYRCHGFAVGRSHTAAAGNASGMALRCTNSFRRTLAASSSTCAFVRTEGEKSRF